MKKTLLFLCGLLTIATLSCIRQEFDLNNDLDTNIRFGGEVMHIPIGTTDSLFLRDFLDADSIDILGTLNGGYAIIVENNINVNVPGIEIFTFDIEPLSNVEIDSGFFLSGPAAGIVQTFAQGIPGGISPQMLNDSAQSGTLNTLLTNEGIIISDYFPLPLFAILDTVINVSMPIEVIDNENITSVDTLWLAANRGFRIEIEPQHVPSGVDIRLDTLHLEFPNSVHLNMSDESVRTRHSFMKRDVQIPETGLIIYVPIEFLTDVYDNGVVSLTDRVDLYARYSLVGYYTGASPFPSDANSSTRLDLSVTSNLEIKTATVTVDFDNDISVDLSGLPDILVNNREGLVLDVNPHLRLRIAGNLDASTTLILEPFGTGVAAPVAIPLDLSSGENLLWIAENDSPLRPNNYDFIPATNLRNLVRTIPDSIVIRLDNNHATFAFDTDYYADMTAQFVVPLTFGDEFSIIIQDTFHLDARIGEMISGNSIGLSVRALNGIPLNLEAFVTPIDENNNPLAGVNVDPFTIVAGMTMDHAPELLMLSDPNNRLQYMRGLVFQFVVSPGASATLRPENFIQIRLNARIEGGVTVDLNNL